MGRVLAIDYGTKRTGLAVTDPLKILANPLETIPTQNLITFLKEYTAKENVEALVLGHPKHLDGNDNEMTAKVLALKKKLENYFPDKKVIMIDERFTSKMALQSMIAMGSKKKDRREKAGNLDKISATIILQSYLEQL